MAPRKHSPHKHAESHRSLASFNFQPTQSRATHPAHRESLVAPRHHSIITSQGDHTDSNMRAEPNTRPGRDRLFACGGIRRPSGDGDLEVYNGWMTKFCVEPSDDAHTCCLGFWVPCVLFAKTHWRLGQVGRGENALKGWTPSMGCTLPCWAHCGLSLICINGVLTGCQSTRIRGTYGIEGSVFKDLCRGYWCPRCAQMQNDREVQAREGVERLKYDPKYLKSRQDGPVDTQPLPHPPMSYAPTQSMERITKIAQMVEVTSRGKKLQKPSPIVEVQVEVPQVQVYAPQLLETKGPEVSAQLEQHQQDWNQEKNDISADRKDHQRAKKSNQERKGKEASRLHSGPQAAVSDVEASRKPGKNTNFPGSSAMDNFSDIRKKTDHERLSRRHPLAGCVVIETECKNKSRSKPKGHALVDCTIIEVDNESPASEHAASDCTMISTKSNDVEEQRRRTDCSGVTVSDTQELSYVHDFTDCPVDEAVLNYFENQEKKLQQHSLTDDSRASLSTDRERRLPQHSLTEDHRGSSSTIGQEKVKQHSLTDDSRGSSTTVVPSYSLFPQHKSSDCPGTDESGSSKSSGRRNRSNTIGSSSTMNSGGLKEHRLDRCPIVTHPTTGDNTPQSNRDSQVTQPLLSKYLPNISKSENEQDSAHVHGETCLTGGLHHKCALYFDISSAKSSEHDNNKASVNTGAHLTGADDTAKGKDGTRQKQRRFKGIRKVNDTNTSSGSNGNKSGRSAEKSAQSAHSQASSSKGGKKENAQNNHGGSNDLVGFPYDIQETTKIIVSHKSEGEQCEQRVEIVGGGDQKSQEGTTSGFWSKVTGKGKESAS
ncbi:uncharacterized protein PAC_06840 [Phialocephala subalpina]|uniref:PLAC8 family protein n=1 Tax=Phialocephala subalpina TaxID=576137 RepID=A0A1L7WVY3_9HELO|nr:uncharacterized protein PAC_06840 [Phialocephala subalpina]